MASNDLGMNLVSSDQRNQALGILQSTIHAHIAMFVVTVQVLFLTTVSF